MTIHPSKDNRDFSLELATLLSKEVPTSNPMWFGRTALREYLQKDSGLYPIVVADLKEVCESLSKCDGVRVDKANIDNPKNPHIVLFKGNSGNIRCTIRGLASEFNYNSNRKTPATDAAVKELFSFQALYYNPIRNEWRDPYMGIDDIEGRVCRVIIPTKIKTESDLIRRVIINAATHNMVIDAATYNMCVANAQKLALTPVNAKEDIINVIQNARRIGVHVGQACAHYIQLLHCFGILGKILPGLVDAEKSKLTTTGEESKWVNGSVYKDNNVLNHSIRVLANLEETKEDEISIVDVLIALLHDYGKRFCGISTTFTSRTSEGEQKIVEWNYRMHEQNDGDVTLKTINALKVELSDWKVSPDMSKTIISVVTSYHDFYEWPSVYKQINRVRECLLEKWAPYLFRLQLAQHKTKKKNRAILLTDEDSVSGSMEQLFYKDFGRTPSEFNEKILPFFNFEKAKQLDGRVSQQIYCDVRKKVIKELVENFMVVKDKESFDGRIKVWILQGLKEEEDSQRAVDEAERKMIGFQYC